MTPVGGASVRRALSTSPPRELQRGPRIETSGIGLRFAARGVVLCDRGRQSRSASARGSAEPSAPPRWVSAVVESEGIAVESERPPARSAPRGFRRGEETRHGGRDSFAKDRSSPLGGPVLTSGAGVGKCALQDSFPRLGWRWVRVLARGVKYFTGGRHGITRVGRH